MWKMLYFWKNARQAELMLKRAVLSIIAIGMIISCTRDDICTEDTPTTPLLIITFNDIANPTQRKSVSSLTVETVEQNTKEVISATTTDSIAVPLRNSAEFTNYRFKKGVGTSEPNTDFVTFTYTYEDIYVNRACAFKTVYGDLDMLRQSEGTANWILQFNVLTTDVTDQNETHITIFH